MKQKRLEFWNWLNDAGLKTPNFNPDCFDAALQFGLDESEMRKIIQAWVSTIGTEMPEYLNQEN